jgi:hypothetical protein
LRVNEIWENETPKKINARPQLRRLLVVCLGWSVREGPTA